MQYNLVRRYADISENSIRKFLIHAESFIADGLSAKAKRRIVLRHLDAGWMVENFLT
jgi:hypothetical protein